MKGVSSVIAAILLLLITVAITGFAFVFLSSMVQSPTQGAEQQVGQQIQQIAATFQIEGVSGNTVYIRNTGTQPLTNLQFLVNNVPVDYTSGPLSLAPNEVGTYALNNAQLAAIPIRSAVRVTSIGWSSEISASPTPGGPDTIPPSVSVSHSPPSPTAGQLVTITATATDGGGISSIVINIDSSDVKTCASSPCIYTVTYPAAGGHTYYATATDTSSNTARDPISGTKSFTVLSGDTTPPTASITSPLDGATVYGTINVYATASDNVGVAGVQFKLNGINLGAEDTSAPYSVSWNTMTVPNTDIMGTGEPTYNLTAIVRDSSGNIANASISPIVFVSNVMAFNEAGGQVVMEAENNDSARAEFGPPWKFASSPPYGGFSGTGYANSSSDTGKAYDYPGTTSPPPTVYHWYAPYLEYNVNFTTLGTYYVWIRGYGPDTAGDTVHLCMGNTTRSNVLTAQNITLSTTQFDWTNTRIGGRATVDVSTAGVNYISMCLGEDGAKVDKILMTTNPSFTPTGNGPAESPRVPSLWPEYS